MPCQHRRLRPFLPPDALPLSWDEREANLEALSPTPRIDCDDEMPCQDRHMAQHAQLRLHLTDVREGADMAVTMKTRNISTPAEKIAPRRPPTVKRVGLAAPGIMPSPDDPTTTDRVLPVGNNRDGQCIQCRRYFSGSSTFDKHQRLAENGDVICLDPATVGLRVLWRNGVAWWAQPGEWRGPDAD